VRKIEVALEMELVAVVRVDELDGFNEAGNEAGVRV
jgi:hypothetical protein